MSEIIRVADKLYKEANPKGNMSPPSMVYEMIEKVYKKWMNLPITLKEDIEFEAFARIITNPTNRSKKVAKLAIAWGYEVGHESFEETELVKESSSNKYYLDEKDELININNFWRYRTAQKWDLGWIIKK